MNRSLIFTFEELPLVVDNGFFAGLVNGEALISYWPDGLFGVVEIYLDGHKRKSERELDELYAGPKPWKLWHEKPVALDRGTPIHSIIHDRLENEWREKVLDAIRDAVEQEAA